MMVRVEFWPEFTGKGPIQLFPVLDEESLLAELGKEYGELGGAERAGEIRDWVLGNGGDLDCAELRAQQGLDGL
jgi:hypothetical protein